MEMENKMKENKSIYRLMEMKKMNGNEELD